MIHWERVGGREGGRRGGREGGQKGEGESFEPSVASKSSFSLGNRAVSMLGMWNLGVDRGRYSEGWG